jgi:Kef-type K+ transport system membrane component KefB
MPPLAALTLTGPGSLLRLALAVAVICACAYAAGRLARRLDQPRVLGEIAAGLLLGPTLLGWLLPGVSAFLFPEELTGSLDSLAKVGVILFVFFVGVEFQSALLRGRGRLLGAIVGGSLLVPLVLGIAVAFPLYSELAGEGVSRGTFALFLGVAISITALPVLATILEDLGLAGRPLGVLAIGCAVVTDLAAWCLLAIVAADAGHGGAGRAGLRLAGAAALAAGAILVARPLVRRLLEALPRRAVTGGYLVVAVGLALGFAWATDAIGVSVIFGAFLGGLAFGGRAAVRERSLGQLRALNRVLLLPVFFVATGLSVDLHTDASAGLLAAAVAVLAVATLGKVGGVSGAARAVGLGRRDSLGLGFLLNTKGLTEIVVLRLGYDLGLISRGALGVLIVVALATTAAAVPALRALGLVEAGRIRAGAVAQVPDTVSV